MLPPITFPAWEACENGSFTLRLSPTAAFGGMQEGSIYYVTLPTGIRKCWNRAEVEQVCRDYLDQREACPDDEYEPEYPEWDRACSAGDDAYQDRMEAM